MTFWSNGPQSCSSQLIILNIGLQVTNSVLHLMTLSENYKVLQKWSILGWSTYARMLGVATPQSYGRKLNIWFSHHCIKWSAFLISQKASPKAVRYTESTWNIWTRRNWILFLLWRYLQGGQKNVQIPYKNQWLKSCYYLRKCWWFFHSYIFHFCGHDVCVVKISDYA